MKLLSATDRVLEAGQLCEEAEKRLARNSGPETEKLLDLQIKQGELTIKMKFNLIAPSSVTKAQVQATMKLLMGLKDILTD